MCGCNCGGSVVIQCGGGTSSGNNGKDPGTDTGSGDGPPGSPKPEPRCKTAIVRFESLLVINSGAAVSFLDEDWDVVLEVNGDAANVDNPLQTQDDRRFTFGAGSEVTVPLSVDTQIQVSCGGVFNPNSFIEGSLPSRTRRHGSADNWGLGGRFTLEASNSDRSYEVTYSIDCLTQETASLISRKSVLDLMSQSLASMRQKPKVTDEVSLSLFLGRIGRHGFRVKSIEKDEILLEGPTDIHRFLKRVGRPKADGDRARGQ